MKKRVFLFILLFAFPLMVFADDKCAETKLVTINNGNSVVCDDTLQSAAKLNYTGEAKEVLKNSVCTIKCTENLLVSFDPVVKVLAGMGFRYPLYISAERVCTATYNTAYYEDNMINWVDEYETLGKNTTEGKNKYIQISNLYQDKMACDNFAWSKAETLSSTYEDIKKMSESNKYTLGEVPIKLYLNDSTSVHSTYEWEEIGDSYSSVVTEEKELRPSCDYNAVTRTCDGEASTIKSWTETAKIFGKYTMKNKAYVEKYTGNVIYSETKVTGDYCEGVDKYYVPFNTVTKKGSTTTGLDGYSIKLVVGECSGSNCNGLGYNDWHFNISCKYQVNNLIYPSDETDENNAKYGNTAFQYRIVDLANPFPDRDAYANWYGEESIITSTAGNISSMNRWQINLTRLNINGLKNKDYDYSKFNLDEDEHSEFIKENDYIVDNR